jgi:NADH-quinone oxidoreductase subunit E
MWMVSPPADWFGKETDGLAFAKSAAPVMMMNPFIAWSAMSVASAAMMMAAGQAMGEAMSRAATGTAMPQPAKKPSVKPKARTTRQPTPKEALVRPIVSAEITAAAPVAEPAPVVTKPAAKPAKKAVAKGPSRPAGLEAPRAGKADDLKRISGIGPKLEMVLNDLGIYHFDQISAWSRAEIDWIDDYLQFKGRVDRDQWIWQAKKLAAK